MPKLNPFLGNCQNCLTPWSDILASHPEHGVGDDHGVESTYHITGSGITARHCIGVNPGDKLVVLRRVSIEEQNDYRLADMERHAWGTLERAGLGGYKKNGKYLKTKALWRDVEKRGFRADIDKEWFAAYTVCAVAGLREGIKNIKGQADGELWESLVSSVVFRALELGGHSRVEAIRFGVIKNNASRGGLIAKSNPAIIAFLSKKLRRNRDLTANELWKMIPRDEFHGVKEGSLMLFRKGSKLRTTTKVNGSRVDDGHPLTFSTFRKYVTSARKALSP